MRTINRIKQIIIFSLVSILFGCTEFENALLDACSDMTLTVEMPEEQEKGTQGGQTRATFVQATGGYDMLSEWESDDKIQGYIVQDSKIYELPALNLFDVEGKKAKIRLNLSKSINGDKPFTLYTVYGRDSYYSVEKQAIAFGGQEFLSQASDKFKPALFSKTDFSNSKDSKSLRFRHYGVYEIVHIQNKDEKPVTLSEVYPVYLINNVRDWAYRVFTPFFEASYCYWPMSGKIEQGSRSLDAPASGAVTIGSGEVKTFVSWYLPTGTPFSKSGEICLHYKTDKARQTPIYRSEKLNQVPISGNTYHIQAIWDGEQLAFEAVEKLSLSQSSVELKPTEEAVVEVVGGSGAYAVESSNRVVATAALSGHSLRVKALKAGNATITVTDTKSREKAALTVKVSASDDEDNPLQGHTGNAIFDQLIADMVYVAGGTFDMGATSEQEIEAFPAEKPVHSVTLSSFYLCKYEVTQELWEEVMGENPSCFKGAKLPLETVSWEDCQAFIKTLNAKTGMKFRMPTEAEWEYAARGGRKTYHNKYAGSVKIDKVAWYSGNSEAKTHEVGQLAPNELGLYDMSGNVWEWCQDWYGDYTAEAQTNPVGPAEGSYCVCRGGSWNDNAFPCRVSHRNYVAPSRRYGNYGLRLAL